MKTVQIQLPEINIKGDFIKHVVSIDIEGKGKYAFLGNLLPSGEKIEIEVGSVIIVVEEHGSTLLKWESVDVFTVNQQGKLVFQGHPDKYLDMCEDFLLVRSLVTKFLKENKMTFEHKCESCGIVTVTIIHHEKGEKINLCQECMRSRSRKGKTYPEHVQAMASCYKEIEHDDNVPL
jgi:hypothetical protein